METVLSTFLHENSQFRWQLYVGVAKKDQDNKEQEDDADRCPICLDSPLDPIGPPCGHIFCSGCLAQVRNRSHCPSCRQAGEYTKNAYLDRQLMHVRVVQCPARGCAWKGSFYELETKHFPEACEHFMRRCPACKEPNVSAKNWKHHVWQTCPARAIHCAWCRQPKKIPHDCLDCVEVEAKTAFKCIDCGDTLQNAIHQHAHSLWTCRARQRDSTLDITRLVLPAAAPPLVGALVHQIQPISRKKLSLRIVRVVDGVAHAVVVDPPSDGLVLKLPVDHSGT